LVFLRLVTEGRPPDSGGIRWATSYSSDYSAAG
jgi:hypothetical protein